MSSDTERRPSTRRERATTRRARRFSIALAVVVGVLAVVAGAGAAVSTALGPRVTDVQVDPDAAIAAAGSRLIVTTTQSLAEVDPEQVTVTPATPFRVDTSGRTVGIRFTLPLYDETTYTVRIDGLEGVGGGPTASVEETFTTPALEIFLLQRHTDADDSVFRTDLTGEGAVPVVTAPQIEEYRTTERFVVASTVEDDAARVVVAGYDGQGRRELALPGAGVVTSLQAADRGNTVGFLYTDLDLTARAARESVLYTVSLADPDAEPVAVPPPGEETRVEDWRFVPGTDSILMLSFDGALTLITPDGEAVSLGSALFIHGIAPGGTIAYVDRADGTVAIDLATAEETPIATVDEALGQVREIVPVPGGDGATLRTATVFEGFAVSSSGVLLVEADGAAEPVFEVGPADAILQTCVSPSGRYAAILVAPEVAANTYDGYLLPLFTRLETHIVELADAAPLVVLNGFDISWCQKAPQP